MCPRYSRFLFGNGYGTVRCQSFAADGHACLSPNCAGEKRQIPISADHFLNGVRGEYFNLHHLIMEGVAVEIRKGDGIPLGQIFELPKMTRVVMRGNDHKVWDDAGKENVRPAEVSVQLLRDGRVYDTVALNAGNNWRYTWSDLDDSYSWTVVEQECEDYTVRIERNGITFVITNTYVKEIPDNPTPTEPTKPGLPQTGQPWWPVPLLLTCGLLFLVVGLICRKRYGDGT